MSLKNSKISDIWASITGCTMSVTKEGTTVSLVTNDDVKNYLKKFWDWMYVHPDTQLPLAAFSEYWTYFAAQNAENVYRVYLALNEEYNPLHNYDKSSKITTDTDAHTDTQKNPQVQTTNAAHTITTTDKVAPYDSSTFVNKDQSEVSMPQIQTTTAAHNVEMDYGKQKVTVEEETKGNIGTTTSAQMIQGEKEVRREPLVEYAMDLFVRQYLFMVDTV